ncbi:hypothetical protein WA158_007875 [Blastocystis sp. Blastoise]
MYRNLEKEAQVDPNKFIEKGMITFFGTERSLHCSLSKERLVLYPESWLYKTWLNAANENGGEFYTGYPERNLELIIAHMRGEHINIDMKDHTELSLLINDFNEHDVKPPQYILERISEQKWNDGTKGIYKYLSIINENSIKQKEEMNFMNKNDNNKIVLLNKLIDLMNQLIGDNKSLKEDNSYLKNSINEIKNDIKVFKEDHNSIMNDMKVFKEDHNSIMNDIKIFKEDNDSMMNDIKNLKEDNNSIKNNNEINRINLCECKNDNKSILNNIINLKSSLDEINKSQVNSNNKIDHFNSIICNDTINKKEINQLPNNIDIQNKYHVNKCNSSSSPPSVSIPLSPSSPPSSPSSPSSPSPSSSSPSSPSSPTSSSPSLPSIFHRQSIHLFNHDITDNNGFSKSKILKKNRTYISILNNWLGKERKWKLLFRASEHKYSAREFHKYCDNKGETVTLIKHIGHNNHINIFGGYTDQSWESKKSNYFKPYSKEFLFTLSNEHNIPPTQYLHNDNNDNSFSILYNPSFGPIFGSYDFALSDDCHNNIFSVCNAHSYQHINTPQNSSLFVNTNNPNSVNAFKVDDYEVWQRI